MTTSQTIDGVPRASKALAVLIETFRDCLHRGKQPTFSGGDLKYFIEVFAELRALLDAPAPRAEFKKVEMAHVTNALEDVREKPVLTSNQCHDLAQALNDRLLSPLQLLAIPAEYLAAAQPQGEQPAPAKLGVHHVLGAIHNVPGFPDVNGGHVYDLTELLNGVLTDV